MISLKNLRTTTVRVFLLVSALIFSLGTLPTRAADVTWDGSTDGTWSDGTNWVGGNIPADLDRAIFNGNSTGTTTLDLSTSANISHLIFNDAGTPSHTIGVLGVDTLNIANNGGIDTNAALDADQTIAANLILGDGTANTFRIDTESTTNRIIITGDIDTGAGGTAGIQRLEIGDLSGASGGRTVQIDGNINETGDATYIQLLVGGADLIMNGNTFQLGQGDNTQRSIIRDTATVTVNAGANLGEGLMEIRNGTLNINSDAQVFRDLLEFGDTTQADGNSTLNIGAANTLQLATGITYIDDNTVANTATIAGGNLQITGAARTLIVHNNSNITAANPELAISSNITNDGSDRDLVIRGADNETEGGTVLFSGNNTFGGVTLQAGILQLGSNTSLDTGGDFLTIAARNATQTAANTTATVDLMGNNNTVNTITIGGTNTASTAGTNGWAGSIISTGGAGSLDDVNALTINAGTAGKLNGGAIIGANVTLNYDNSGTNKGITVRDGSATNDLTINGAIRTDAASTTHDFTFLGDGTVSFNGSLGRGTVVGGHDATLIVNRKFILESGTGSSIGGQQNFTVQQRNNAALSDFDVEFDINGETLVLNDQFTVGATTSTSVNTQKNILITDSAGGGLIRLTGSTDNNQTLKYEHGGGTFDNLQAIINPDILFNRSGANFTATINVEDGADAVDLILNGNLKIQRADTLALRGFNKSSTGTLQINSTNNANSYTTMNIQVGTVRIAGDGSLGNSDVLIGTNANTGTLDYFGSGETINNQIRVGDNTAGATRTGGATIMNSGSGTVTFSSGTFNQVHNAANATRTLTLTGTSGIAISGAIVDNDTADGATVSLAKTGTNIVSLNGDNTYTGNTTVSAGTLNINGTNVSEITVASGAALGGEGSTSGNLIYSGTAYSMDVDGSTAAALGSSGTGSTDVSAVNVSGFNINITTGGSGTFDVLTYGSGGLIGALDRFSLGTTPTASARGAGALSDSGTAITYDLGYVDNTWTGNVSGVVSSNWDIGTTTNWENGADSVWQDGDSAIFGDTHAGGNVVASFTPTLLSNITATNITFTNDTTNAYTIGSNTTEILNFEGVLTSSAAAHTTINSILGGNGSIIHGDGNDGVLENFQLRLNGANTYTGGTTITEGGVHILHEDGAGTGSIFLNETGTANVNQDPRFDIDVIASGWDVDNAFIIGNDGGAKTIRYDVTGTGNSGQVSGPIATLEVSFQNFQLNAGTGETLTISGVVSGLGAASINGLGTTVLSGTNTFAGDLGVQLGTLEVATIGNQGQASNVGAGNTIILGIQNNTGTLNYTGSGNTTDRQISVGRRTSGNARSGGGILNNNGTGALIFNNAAFNILEPGNETTVAARTLTLGGNHTGINQITGVIQDNDTTPLTGDETVSLIVNGSTWQFGGNNTYTGTTTVSSNGTLRISDETNLGAGPGAFDAAALDLAGGTLNTSASFVINDTNRGITTTNGTINTDASTTLQIDNVIAGNTLNKAGTGTLLLGGNNTFTALNVTAGTASANTTTSAFGTNSAIDVASGTTLDLNSTAQTIGSLTGAGTVTSGAAGAASLNIGGGNITSTTSSTTIQDGAGTLSLQKVGTGTVTLAANATTTYTGLTSVSQGTLIVESALGAGQVIVDSGATLGGEGSTAGLLALGLFNTNANLSVDASTAGAFTSVGLNTGLGTHTVNFSAGPVGTGNITILNYGAGTFTGDAATDFIVGTGLTVSGRGGAFSNNVAAMTIELSTGFADRTWNGNGGNITHWVSGDTTDNWQEGDLDFFDGDFVTFDDTAGAAGPVQVDLQGSVAPATITFNNGTKDYTLDDITAGVETLSATTGGLNVTGAGNVTINAQVTGATGITHSGTGTLTIGGGGVTNDFTGNISVTGGGTLKNGDATNGNHNGFGASTNTISITGAGSTLDINAGGLDSGLKAYGAGSIVFGAGTILTNTGADTRSAFATELDFAGDVTIEGTSRMDFDSTIGVSGSNITITYENNDFANINGNQNGASIAAWIINDGEIRVNNGNSRSLGANAVISVNSGGTLGITGGATATREIANDIILGGGTIRSIGTVPTTTGSQTFSGNITVNATSRIDGGDDRRVTTIGGTVITGTGGNLNIGNGDVRFTTAANLTGFTGELRLIEDDAIISIDNGVTLGTTIVNTDTGAFKMLELADSGGASGSGNITGTITNNESGAANDMIIRAYATDTLTLSGVIDDTSAAGFNINGIRSGVTAANVSTGTVIFNADNTYNQETIIAAGTLQVGTGGTTGTLGTTAAIANNGTLVFNTSDDNAYTAVISGTGNVTHSGTGTTTLSGNNSYTGATAVNAGTLSIGGTNTSEITIASGANLDGEGSTSGNITWGGATHAITVDRDTVAALGSTGAGSSNVTALGVGGFTVNIVGTTAGNINVLTYGSGGFLNDADGLTIFNAVGALGGHGTGFTDNAVDTIVFNTGVVDNTWVGGVDGNWDINSTANWSNSSDAIYFDNDNVIFNGAAATKTVLISGNNVVPGTVTFADGSGTYTLSSNASETLTVGVGGLNFSGNATTDIVTINTELVGSGTITKGQAAPGAPDVGQTILTVDNSNFTGVTLINQGDLEIRDINALGNDASNTITIDDLGDNGELHIATQGTLVNDFTIANNGNNKTIRFDNGGNTAARAATLTGNVTIQETNGALIYNTEGQTENGDYGGTTTGFTERNTHVLTVSGQITSSAAASDATVTKTDQGTLILTNAANDFTGRVDINAGTVKVASIGNIGEASHLGGSRSNNAFDIRLGQNNNTGTLIYTGAGAESTDRQVRIGTRQQTGNNNTGGGQIVNNGGGALVFTAANFNSAETSGNLSIGARTLTLAGQFTGTNEIDGIIINNASNDGFVDETVGVTVDTNGTWQLDGASTYTGNTTVAAGTLLINGSTAAGSAVTVNNGGTLGGSGTIGGNIAVNSGGTHTAGTTNNATPTAIQNITGDITYADNAPGASITWDLIDNSTDAGTAADQFILAGGTIEFANVTEFVLDFNGSGTDGSVDWDNIFWDTNQAWTVFSGADTLTTFSSLSLSNATSVTDAGGQAFNASRLFDNDGFTLAQSGNNIILNYSAAIPEPGTYGIFGLGLFLFGWNARRRRRKAAAAEVISD